MTRFLGLGALAAALVAGLSAPATAAFTIDDFSTGSQTVGPVITGTQTGSVASGAILGGERTITTTVNSNLVGTPNGATVSVFTGPGILTSSNDFGVDSTVRIRYDGVGNPGPGFAPVDLTAFGNKLVIEILGIDLSVSIYASVNGVQSGPLTNLTPGLASFNLSDFGAAATAATSIEFRFESPANADFAISLLGVQSIPEPASISMAAAGLVAVGGFARRKFAKKA